MAKPGIGSVGELALDGTTRPANGALLMAIAVAAAGGTNSSQNGSLHRYR
jgi:hypothetical protein